MSENLSYNQAVDYVLQSKMTAYAFLPKKKGDVVRGCELFLLVYCEHHKKPSVEHPEYNLEYFSGLYSDFFGEEDSYRPDEIPSEAKEQLYFKSFEKSIATDYEVHITLKQLNGIPLDRARFDVDCDVCEKSILDTGRLSLCKECRPQSYLGPLAIFEK